MPYTTIDNPELYFQIVLWSGNSSSPRTITLGGSENMQADLIWSKKRSGADYGQIYDAVRTFGASKELVPSDAFDEGNSTNLSSGLGFISSVTSDGFVLTEGNHGTSSIRSLLLNHSGSTHVGWCWKASGSTASNTNGTNITSTVSANTTSGFSIVSWTGDNSGSSTVGHGLGKTAEFVAIKNRADSANWQVKHKNNSANASQSLDATDPESSRAGSTNGGIADLSGTTTFGFIAGSAGVPAANGASDAMIAYVWNSVQGFSKFGSYTGGADAFVYLGFKPAFIMFKNASASENWRIVDNKRDTYNPAVAHLYPNLSAAEGSGASYNDFVDFTAQGFKIRSGSGEIDGSGNTIIYMAFAEASFVNSNGVPTTAR